MIDEPKVWISSRKLKRGKRSYHLRWIDPTTGKWRNERVGTDSKRAEREATLREEKLRLGIFQDVQHVSWSDFVKDDIAKSDQHRE